MASLEVPDQVFDQPASIWSATSVPHPSHFQITLHDAARCQLLLSQIKKLHCFLEMAKLDGTSRSMTAQSVRVPWISQSSEFFYA